MSDKVQIVFLPSGMRIRATPGTGIDEAARQAGADLQNVCGGGGKCGKCRVRAVPAEAAKTALSPPTDEELRALAPHGPGGRMAPGLPDPHHGQRHHRHPPGKPHRRPGHCQGARKPDGSPGPCGLSPSDHGATGSAGKPRGRLGTSGRGPGRGDFAEFGRPGRPSTRFWNKTRGRWR